jgi:hypothetical protein
MRLTGSLPSAFVVVGTPPTKKVLRRKTNPAPADQGRRLIVEWTATL